MPKAKTPPKAKEQKKAKKKEEKGGFDESEWDEEWDEGEDRIEDDEEEVATSKHFTKIKDLTEGMNDVNVEAVVDFVGQIYGKEYGENPYVISFIKDDTGEVKITFWADDIKKAKKGCKIKVKHANVTAYKGQLQINPNRKYPIEFL